MAQLRAKGLLSVGSTSVLGKRKGEEHALGSTKKMKTTSSDDREFQTAQDLYTALKDAIRTARPLGGPQRFTGHYCIAKALAREVSTKRVDAATRDLVKGTGLKVRYDLQS